MLHSENSAFSERKKSAGPLHGQLDDCWTIRALRSWLMDLGPILEVARPDILNDQPSDQLVWGPIVHPSLHGRKTGIQDSCNESF